MKVKKDLEDCERMFMAMVGQLQEIKKKVFLALQQNHFWWLRLTAVIGFYTLHTKRLEYEKKMIRQTVSKLRKKIIYVFS